MPEFIEAWRRIHFIAQAAVEAGKSWGRAMDDDSHSALEIAPGMFDVFESKTAVDDVVARLSLDDGLIEITNGDREFVMMNAGGKTLPELKAFVREYVGRFVGEPKQAAVPAPDLPDHPAGSGGRFSDAVDSASLEVTQLYVWTQLLLEAMVSRVKSLAVDGEHELTPRLWPHHFDLASLVVVRRDPSGAMTRTIGVGITPPDGIDETGYWYVSPWSSTDVDAMFETPSLPIGRWVDRGSFPMAVLPIGEVFALGERRASERLGGAGCQQTAIAEFVASAFNACADHFDQS